MGQKHKRASATVKRGLKMSDVHRELERLKGESKRKKAKRHMDTLWKYRWNYERKVSLGKEFENKTVYVPYSTDMSMLITEGWRVMRIPTYQCKITGRIKKRKNKWVVVKPGSNVFAKKFLRTSGKGRIRFFSCPADAIVAAENAARKAFAYAEVKLFGPSNKVDQRMLA